MKISLSLLKQFLSLTLSPKEIADALTLAGLEVEGIDNETPSFSNVVAASILSVKKHPEADRLQIAEVSDGTDRFQIVCGAPNCRAGITTALARIGASLEDEEGKAWKIKKSKLRNVESYGMLCSKKELNISEDADGIVELPEEIQPGADLSLLLCDPVFDISLTPNLGHCMSARGIARELAAIINENLLQLNNSYTENDTDLNKKIRIRVKEAELCKNYAVKMMENIEVGPSPFWLQQQLEACGMRSVNNIVDCTNLVMLEYGQPMHAFDYDQIKGKSLDVAFGKEVQDFLCLDDVSRRLDTETLLINDASGPVAVAGIMGGLDSAVSVKTKNILLECACFDPISIRKASKRLGLRSESSQRFEKGVDPNAAKETLDRLCSLIQQVAGGEVVQGFLEVTQGPFPQKQVPCRLSRINKILGTHLSLGEVETIFHRLSFKTKIDENEVFTVSIPTFRNDISLEIDLIEEVARIHGLNFIEKKNPLCHTSPIAHSPLYLGEKLIRKYLCRQGLQEMIACDLISPKLISLIRDPNIPQSALVEIMHSKSIESSFLRPSLLPGILQIVQKNLDHKNYDIQAFELGHIYLKKEATYTEQMMAAIVLTGNNTPAHWDEKPKPVDFYDLKGHLESLFSSLGIKDITYSPSNHPSFHPNRQANLLVEGVNFGVMGEIHPSELQTLGIKERVLFSECSVLTLLQKKKEHIRYDEIPSYPTSERDWTLTLQDEFSLHQIFDAIYDVNSHLLEKVSLIDLYKSKQLGEDKKNVTFRLIYRDRTKTISFEEVEKEHMKITQAVFKKLNLAI